MTDMHIHILPGVDDGASSWEESLAMARCAEADGITAMVCTPHMDAEADGLEKLAEHTKKREELQRRLADEGIPLRLLGGAEWLLTPDLLDVVEKQGRLGESRAFLFELSPFMPIAAAEPLARSSTAAGLLPVLAHPERHPWLNEKNVSLLEALAARGCFFQLTAGSLAGEFGKNARRTGEAIALALPERVILASDAHHIHARRPLLRAGYEALEKLRQGMAGTAKNNLDNLLRSK